MPSGADGQSWLQTAEEDALALLREAGDLTILYAMFRHLWIVSVFAPAARMKKPNKKKLYDARIEVDAAWCIQRIWGGGKGHRVCLEPPLEFEPRHPLRGAEPITFYRSFTGVQNQATPVEISQKLVHALGLHFVKSRNAYCRLNSDGDIEDVIHVFQDEGTGNFDDRACVLISSKALAEFMAVGDYALFRKFDVTRFPPSNFSDWDNAKQHFERDDLFYYAGLSRGGGSYVHGGQILRSVLTVEDMVEEWKATEDRSNRRYESFIIHDWKNKRIIEWSSAPDALSNYFQTSEKPFETSPAFFKPQVLVKYKADPEKYDLRDRSISCRNAWYLKTYDVNEAGQVHTYIGYLQNLPYSEQQYWKLYNERPKAPISKRAYESDFQGSWASEEDPLQALRHAVSELDGKPPAWWKQRGDELSRRVHYPVTNASKEWADELQLLDQFIVEGFVAKELRRLAEGANAELDRNWQSLKIIETLLRLRGQDHSDEIVAPLRSLHHLRSKVSGHHTKERVELEQEALAKYGSFPAHFRALCKECNESFAIIIDSLHATK